MIHADYELDLSPAERLKASGIRKAIRIGANRASSKVKAAVVAGAEKIKLRGLIAKSIRIKVKVYPGDKFVSIVGPSRSFKRSGGTVKRGPHKGEKRKRIPATYATLVVKGTKRFRGKDFLTPALAATWDQYCADASRETGREIELELQRQSAKAGK